MYRFRQCSMHISGQFIFDSYKPDSKISCKQHNRRIQDIRKFLTADCNSTSCCFLYDRYTLPSESRAYTRSTNNHRIIPECRTMEIRVRLTLYLTSATLENGLLLDNIILSHRRTITSELHSDGVTKGTPLMDLRHSHHPLPAMTYN